MRSKILPAAILAIGLALGMSEAAKAATATTSVSLGSSYTDLGAGPLQIQAGGQPVSAAISDNQPSASSPGFSVSATIATPFNTTSHVWARATSTAPTVVTVAPLSAPASGGSGGTSNTTVTQNVPLASGSGGTTGATLSQTVNPSFLTAATTTRRALVVTNQSPPASGGLVTMCSTSVPNPVTPVAYAGGCYTFGPGGQFNDPASGYVHQDGYAAVCSIASCPVTIDNH